MKNLSNMKNPPSLRTIPETFVPIPKAPSHLSAAAKAWWAQLHREYDLHDGAALLLLESALSAFDVWQNAVKVLAKEGNYTYDRFKRRQPHPAIAAVRDAQETMLRALNALHLDLEPLRNAPGRPPGR